MSTNTDHDPWRDDARIKFDERLSYDNNLHPHRVRYAHATRLVPPADEPAPLDQFLSLVTIRYAAGLTVAVEVDAAAAERWQIPPVVLPELLENAVKHNELSTDNPLQIEIRLDGDRLIVAHKKRPRRSIVNSTGVGLENLAQRFKLTTCVAARWGETGGRFVVMLPLVAADGSNIAK